MESTKAAVQQSWEQASCGEDLYLVELRPEDYPPRLFLPATQQ